MSILSSYESERRWVVAMEKNFPQNETSHIDFTGWLCVVRVPETLSEQKPEAYAPRRLGLGPFHHLRPHLYTFHNHKLAAITKFLTPEKLQNLHLAVEALLPFEPLVRACYDEYLDLDIATLAWIFVIDGLYLLHFLRNFRELKHLAADVLMMENQIPLILLDIIRHALQLPDIDPRAFLKVLSPLELDATGGSVSSYAHLLHRMYDLILSNRGLVPQMEFTPHMKMACEVTEIIKLDHVDQGMQFLADRGVPGAGAARQVLSFVSKIPWDKISAIFKKDELTPSVEEIDIPSVSQMTEIAKIKFIRTPGGIRDIRFDDEEKKFYLPSIKVSTTTETVLRNLMAFEAAIAAAAEQSGATLELREYVDLMCGIIDSVKDVEILREEGIVKSELGAEDIAVIFNSIRKSDKKKTGNEKTKVEEAIESVNTGYSNLMRVKVSKLVREYGYASFKFMSVIISIAVVLLLILQAFCSVFGCSSWFSKTGEKLSFSK